MQGPAVFMDVSLEDQVSLRQHNLAVFGKSNKLLECWCIYKYSWFQALELRKYFKSLGAEIAEEKSPKGIEDDLHKIVGVCDVCFKEPNEAEIEAILNSIVSIMVSVSALHCKHFYVKLYELNLT